MDQQHREELERNDLYVFLSDLWKWMTGKGDEGNTAQKAMGKYGVMTLLIISGVLFVLLGYRYLDAKEAGRINSQGVALASAQLVDDYVKFDEVSGASEQFKSLGKQFAGDVSLDKALKMKVVEEKEGGSVDAEVKKLLNLAIDNYKKALTTPDLHPARKHAAKIGLAIASTGLSDLSTDEKKAELLKQARELYESVSKEAAEAYPHFAIEAKKRLEGMALLSEIEVVVLDPDPVAPAEEAKPEGESPAESKPEEGKAEDAKAEDAKPAEAKPEETKPADVKAEEAKPAEAEKAGAEPKVEAGEKKDQ